MNAGGKKVMPAVMPVMPANRSGGIKRRVALPEVALCGVGLHAVSEQECVAHILDSLDEGHGGWVVTPNLDHLRRIKKDPDFERLYTEADVRVVDGMIPVWACSLQRTPVPERVTGSDMISTLSEAAAQRGRSIYMLGGNEGTDVGAARVLQERYPGLTVAGTDCPPFGFDKDAVYMGKLARRLRAADPDIVFVALGSPKQERVIRRLKEELPGAWWLGVGVSFSFLTGDVPRAPRWMQRLGLEWMHRLASEPRRLFRRYIIQGLPFALTLLGGCAIRGTLPQARKGGKYGASNPVALLVDDDEFAIEHLQVILETNFPEVEIQKRLTPDVSGEYDFLFLDNDFDGQLLATDLAQEARAAHSNATIFAFSAFLDVPTLKGLINAGCDGACDKSDPASWRPVIEHMRYRLQQMESDHIQKKGAFGGVRQAAESINLLLQDWNSREETAATNRGSSSAEDDR